MARLPESPTAPPGSTCGAAPCPAEARRTPPYANAGCDIQRRRRRARRDASTIDANWGGSMIGRPLHSDMPVRSTSADTTKKSPAAGPPWPSAECSPRSAARLGQAGQDRQRHAAADHEGGPEVVSRTSVSRQVVHETYLLETGSHLPSDSRLVRSPTRHGERLGPSP
jgi:hypothetical protein